MKPSTPAAAGHVDASDVGDDDDEGALPPAPSLGIVVGAVVAGFFVFVGVIIVTVCVLMAAKTVLPTPEDRAGPAVVGAIAGVIVVMAASAWVRALRGARRDASRWIALSFPFFGVVGVVCGVAFVDAALSDEATMFPHRSNAACRRATGVDSGPTVDACVPVADACQRQVLDAGGVRADLDDCVRLRLTTH